VRPLSGACLTSAASPGGCGAFNRFSFFGNSSVIVGKGAKVAVAVIVEVKENVNSGVKVPSEGRKVFEGITRLNVAVA
jgi:hypothetical protein